MKLSKKYIKAYKGSSIAIMLSILLSIALIVGVETLKATNDQLEILKYKYAGDPYGVIFSNLTEEQVHKIEKNKNIKHLGLASVYSTTSKEEQQQSTITGANDNYILRNSILLQGKLPRKRNEMAAEAWVLENYKIEPKIDQDIRLKVINKMGKTESETFHLVGIISDNASRKSKGEPELYIPIDADNQSKFYAYVEFKDNVNRYKESDEIRKAAGIKETQISIDDDLAALISSNTGFHFLRDYKIIVILSFICGIVIFGVYKISFYKRIREYGILRAVGLNKAKLFQLIFQELFYLYLIAVPIGVLTGFLGAVVIQRFAGSVQTRFEFFGNEITIGLVFPIFIIISCIIIIGVLLLLISLFTCREVQKQSIMDSIHRSFNIVHRKHNVITVDFLRKFIKPYQAIALKNSFRYKGITFMIILSMSVCGILFISLNYKLSIKEENDTKQFEQKYWNGDYMLNEYNDYTTVTGISKETLQKIQALKGVKNLETGMYMPSRLIIDDEDILAKDFYKLLNESASDIYYKSYSGMDKNGNEFVLKNSIRGYNRNALNKLTNYLIEGTIDANKMENEDVAVLFIPQFTDKSPVYFGKGKSVAELKVGDKITVKFRKDKDVASKEYWTLEDKGAKYQYKDFTVGAVVYYPYMTETSPAGGFTPEVIISEKRFKKITGIKAYNTVNVVSNKKENDIKLEKEITKIATEDKGVVTSNIIKEKENILEANRKTMVYNLGITLILFVITIANIINNIGFSILSRTNEFGILRAIGLNEEALKKMILFEGVLYGIFSSIITAILSYVLQIYLYNHSGVKTVASDFNINYWDYVIVIVSNIILGGIIAYRQSNKIYRTPIMECINTVE
jgi:ABC-type transport system, involved in lipoprotein release, permease component